MRTVLSWIVNSAMGQIPCSTERISCHYYYYYYVRCIVKPESLTTITMSVDDATWPRTDWAAVVTNVRQGRVHMMSVNERTKGCVVLCLLARQASRCRRRLMFYRCYFLYSRHAMLARSSAVLAVMVCLSVCPPLSGINFWWSSNNCWSHPPPRSVFSG